MIRSSLLAVLVAGLTAPADNALAQRGDGRWFGTVQYGQADYQVMLKGDEPWWGDVDDDGDAFALGFGYHLVPQLGIRVMYERGTGIGATNRCPEDRLILCPAIVFRESTRTDNWSVVAMPRLRFSNAWELYGTAGAMRWRIRPDDTIANSRGTDFLYGAGLSYRFANGFGIGAEYQASNTEYQTLRLTASFEF
jgi:opacity protein-like surface antigen